MADEKEVAAIEEGGKAKAKAKKPSDGEGKNYLLTAVLVLNVILMVAIAYLQFTAHQRQKERQDVRDLIREQVNVALDKKGSMEDGGKIGPETDGLLYPLKGFTANLAQGDGPRRFLRMTAVLKFSKTSREEEFKAREPQIRDRIISIINSKRPEDLLKVEGKAYLKEEIKAAINAFLVDGHVVDVFYVGFQIN